MHNEVSRSRVHGHVVQAHEIGELHVHGREVTYPPLTSWHDRPDLTAELEDLLHLQRDAAETLPYRLLGVKHPELTRVYVQQSVRETESRQGDRPVPVGEALAGSKHLLVTGEPGAGKSTFVQMYVQRLATEWLDPSADPPLPEPVMPLRIPAKALADDLPWSELLANAVRDRRLNATLKPELFARRALGARWLIFVDGLDEIAEPERRDRVIDALVSRMRRGSEHRLVITTRPLPPEELQKLQNENVDSFTIQAFGPVELREFASGWFRAQDPTRAIARAEDFVSQVHDGRLRELVRNPLLATIAAIANTLEPHRKLPHNRTDLYQRFMSYLLEDKASGRNMLAEFRRGQQDDPARVRQVEWLYRQRENLIEHLAVQRLESERGLLDVATEWLADTSVRQEDLLSVLTSTGVFVHGEEGLRFLHHSFAEFLAARVRAASIPASFPDLDEWVKLGTQPGRETSVLFTFTLWGRKAGNELDVVLERALAGGLNHVLLVGRLLAEDVDISATRAGQAADRLLQLMLANGTKDDPWQDAQHISRVLAGLGSDGTGKVIATHLREMRDNADLAPVVRIGSAVVLGHLDTPVEAAGWLQECADLQDPHAARAIAKGIAEILPDGTALASDLLVRLANASGSPPLVMTAVEILLTDLDCCEAAGVLLRGLVGNAAAYNRPLSWGVLAEQAARAGCATEAVFAAEAVFAQSSPGDCEIAKATKALLECGGNQAVKQITDRAGSLTLEQTLIVAECLRPADRSRATGLARLVAESRAASEDQFLRACQILAVTAPRQIGELITKHSAIDSGVLVPLASALARAGNPTDGLIERALVRYDARLLQQLRRMVPMVLELGDFGLHVHLAVNGGFSEHWSEAAPLLYHAGYTKYSGLLITKLVSHPINAAAAIACLDGMIGKEIPEQAAPLLDALHSVIEQQDPLMAKELAHILHRAGHTSDAAEIALSAFRRSLGGSHVEECVATLLALRGAYGMDYVVRMVLEANLGAGRRNATAKQFAEHGLLDHAVSLWLDVVRRHGNAVGEGIEAASRLVTCGRRAQAAAQVREELTGDGLGSRTRTNLTALLAWLEA